MSTAEKKMTNEKAISCLKAMITTHKSLELQGKESSVPMDDEDIKALNIAIAELRGASKTELLKELRAKVYEAELFYSYHSSSDQAMAIEDILNVIDKFINKK